MENRERVRMYIIESSMCDSEKINDSTLIFDQGLLDSMGLLFLVQFLKDEFKVDTSDHELIKENFESVNAIVSFIETKVGDRKAQFSQKLAV